MAFYDPETGEIEMEGTDPTSEWGSSLWVHENVHKAQHRQFGDRFQELYDADNWRFEREAYYAQICFLIQSGIEQSRFAWLRDILDMNYSGASPDRIKELFNEIQMAE